MGFLGWAILFFVVALICAAFGLRGPSRVASIIARFCFLIFIIVCIVLIILWLVE